MNRHETERDTKGEGRIGFEDEVGAQKYTARVISSVYLRG